MGSRRGGGRRPARGRDGTDRAHPRRGARRPRRRVGAAGGDLVGPAPRGRDARGHRRRRTRRPDRLRPAGHRHPGARAGGLPGAAELVPPPQAGHQPDAGALHRGAGAAVPADLQAGLGPAGRRGRGGRVPACSRSPARSRRSSGSASPPAALLLTDWLPPWSGWDDALCLVFDGGEHDASLLDRWSARPARSGRPSSAPSTRPPSAAPTSPPAGSAPPSPASGADIPPTPSRATTDPAAESAQSRAPYRGRRPTHLPVGLDTPVASSFLARAATRPGTGVPALASSGWAVLRTARRRGSAGPCAPAGRRCRPRRRARRGARGPGRGRRRRYAGPARSAG